MPVTTRLKLSELAGQIEALINDSFYQTTCWVLADVIDYKIHEQKGHHYFCLAEKDPDTHSVIAKIAAVAWKGRGASSIAGFEQITGQRFRSNIHVLARVSVQYNAVYGLKLILHEVDPTYTIGILEQHRRETLQQLVDRCPDYVQRVGDSYHTRNKSLALAPVLQRIAVVTSSGAEGFHDFRDTIDQNRYGYAITLDTWFTSVQGEANAEGVCRQLIDIYQSGIAYDAVVIIRGGGSQADLLLFEQFVIARAVAKFPIPIITGIGHHINQSIADLMAHTSVKTPSIAAEFIIAHNRAFEEEVLSMQQSLIIQAQQILSAEQESLSGLRAVIQSESRAVLAAAREDMNILYGAAVRAGRKLLYGHSTALQDAVGRLLIRPKIITHAKACDLDHTRHNLRSAARRYLTLQQCNIDHLTALHRILNPVNILKRGFAVVYSGEEIVTGGEGLEADTPISIRFYESKLTATVTSKTPLDGSIANL